MTSYEAIANMWFWIFLVALTLGCVVMQENRNKESWLLPKSLYFLLFLIAAFRYGIGPDYWNYSRAFGNADVELIEPFFQYTAIVLKKLGFSAQMLFLVYNLLSSIFLWKAFRYYLKTPRQVVFMIALFVLFGDGGWWASLNYIRQWLAVSIFVWGSRFLVEDKPFKYIGMCIFLGTIHYSSIVLVLLYPIRYLKLSKKCNIALLLLSIFFLQFSVLRYVLQYIMSALNVWRYNVYFNWTNDFGSSIGLIILLVLWVFILWKRSNVTAEYIMSNVYLYGVIIMIPFMTSGPLFRMRMYFQIFGFLMLPIILERFKFCRKQLMSVVLILYTCMFIGHLYRTQLDPIAVEKNVRYEVNFCLRE